MSKLVDQFRERARKLGKTIVLPESLADPRTLKAARAFLDEGLGKPLIVGANDALLEAARQAQVSLEGIQSIDIDTFPRFGEMVALYQQIRAKDNPAFADDLSSAPGIAPPSTPPFRANTGAKAAWRPRRGWSCSRPAFTTTAPASTAAPRRKSPMPWRRR